MGARWNLLQAQLRGKLMRDALTAILAKATALGLPAMTFFKTQRRKSSSSPCAASKSPEALRDRIPLNFSLASRTSSGIFSPFFAHVLSSFHHEHLAVDLSQEKVVVGRSPG